MAGRVAENQLFGGSAKRIVADILNRLQRQFNTPLQYLLVAHDHLSITFPDCPDIICSKPF